MDNFKQLLGVADFISVVTEKEDQMKKMSLTQIKEEGKAELRNTRNWLFSLCLVWSIPLMLLIILEFSQIKIYRDLAVTVPATFTRLYYTILLAYATAKGKYRWDNPNVEKKPGEKKPGELFVILWWILGLLICVIHSTTGWTLPKQLPEIMMAVIGIFVSDKVATKVASLIRTKKETK